MPTKAETARSNGALSQGPVTESGKAISARNATKHGLTSSRVVLPQESQEEYDALESSIINRFNPADELEMDLAKEMAAARWRLRRLESMESAFFKKVMREQQEALGPHAHPDDVRDAAYAEVAESKTLRMLSRHQGQLRRAYEKAWKEIGIIQEARQFEEENAEEDAENDALQNEPTRFEITPELSDKVTAFPYGITAAVAIGSSTRHPAAAA